MPKIDAQVEELPALEELRSVGASTAPATSPTKAVVDSGSLGLELDNGESNYSAEADAEQRLRQAAHILATGAIRAARRKALENAATLAAKVPDAAQSMLALEAA